MHTAHKMITMSTPNTIPNDMNSVEGVKQNIVSVGSAIVPDSETADRGEPCDA